MPDPKLLSQRQIYLAGNRREALHHAEGILSENRRATDAALLSRCRFGGHRGTVFHRIGGSG